jgi:hypothetical protein
VPRPLLSLHSSATIVTCRPPSAAGGPISRRSSSSLAHLLVGCYTADHEALAYYTNTAEDGGAYVVGLDTSDGSLTVLDGPVEAGTNPTYAATNGSAAFFTCVEQAFITSIVLRGVGEGGMSLTSCECCAQERESRRWVRVRLSALSRRETHSIEQPARRWRRRVPSVLPRGGTWDWRGALCLLRLCARARFPCAR